MAILHVKALTVRFVLPSSRTKNTSPLVNEKKMTNMAIMMMNLVNICYTPHFNKKIVMLSVARFKSRFTLLWQINVLGLLIIAILIRLGFWQLERAEVKKQMLSKHRQFEQQRPHIWQPSQNAPMQYQPIRVEGTFMSTVILYDNQHYQHQVGYHVISPLMVSSHHVLLVDRGWVPAHVNRRSLPSIKTPSHPILIEGQVYYPSKNSWLLGQNLEKVSANLLLVERIDTQLISQLLHKNVYPFIIRLGPREKHGFQREWAIVSMPPERHHGYALQWFAMALIVLIGMIRLNMKKRYENNAS